MSPGDDTAGDPVAPETEIIAKSAFGNRGEEGALLVRHLAGDPVAFAELVEAYRAPVFGYLVRCGIAETDRDDLFQDIFIKVHRAAPSYQTHRPLHPWLFTIVCNTVRTHLRRRRVRQLIFSPPTAEEPTDTTPDGERRSVARQTVAFLESEIRRLPLAHREVLLLAAVDRRPLKDVSEALGVPLGTVKTHLRRARLALARALAEHHLPREAQS